MNAHQLRMAMAMLELTVKELSERSGVSRGTIMRLTAGLPVVASNLKVVKSFLETEDIVFIEATGHFDSTVARRRGYGIN